MAQCIDIPVTISEIPIPPVETGCSNPTGEIGQISCRGFQEYTCASDGEWIATPNKLCVGGVSVDTKFVVIGAAALVALALISSGGRRRRDYYEDEEY